MSDSYYNSPQNPTDIVLRPLTKGIVRNKNQYNMEIGEFLDCKNYDITETGLRRRSGVDQYSSYTVDYPPIQGITTLWDTSGIQHTIIIDSKFVYEVTLGGLNPIYFEYSHGLIEASGTYIIGSESTAITSGTTTDVLTAALIDTGATFEIDGIEVGDTVYNTTDSTSSIVSAIVSDTQLTLEDDIFTSGEGYTIHHNTLWNTNRVLPGDLIVIDADGSGDGPETIIINSVEGEESLLLDEAPSGTYTAGTDYTIYKALSVNDPYKLSWTHTADKVVFADGRRPLYAYDGTTFGAFSDDLTFIPQGVLYYKNRLWAYNTRENGVHYRHRIRWSSPTDVTSFIGNSDTQWLDRPETQGELFVLTSLGDLMIALYTDRVEIGRATSYSGNTLPYAFSKLETGFVGVVGMHAYTSFLDAVFFVGQNDIYAISPDSSINKIGSKIIERTLNRITTLQNIEVTHDRSNDCILFALPIETETPNELWKYFYKTNAWSYSDIVCNYLGVNTINTSYSWSDLSDRISPDDWSGMSIFPSWNSIHGTAVSASLYMAFNGTLYTLNSAITQDSGSSPISCVLESGDLDINVPNRDKTFLRMSVRLKEKVASQLEFTVSGSVDSGDTWTGLGTLTIYANTIEGKLDFRLTGSAVRYKLETGGLVLPYEISEIILRVKGRGIEQTIT